MISQLWGELGLPRSPCGEVHCAERYLAETISYVKLCEYVDGIAGRLNMFCYALSLYVVEWGRLLSASNRAAVAFNARTGITRAEKYKYQKHVTAKLHENLYLNAALHPQGRRFSEQTFCWDNIMGFNTSYLLSFNAQGGWVA